MEDPDPKGSLEWFGYIGAGIMIVSLLLAVGVMVLAGVALVHWLR